MKPDIKAEWVAALRSGEYEQTTHVLRQTEDGKDGYCCLGVLCELAVKAGVIAPPRASSRSSTGSYTWEYELCDAVPPEKVGAWAGFELRADFDGDEPFQVVNPSVEADGRNDLAALNDGGYSFREIADVIEAQL